MFWRRWKTEYLTLMQERSKWRTTASSVQIGSFALIPEDNEPPGQWLLEKVSELHPGCDGAVRVVELTIHGVLEGASKARSMLAHQVDI